MNVLASPLLSGLVSFTVVFLSLRGYNLVVLRRRVIRRVEINYCDADNIPAEQRHVLELPQAWLQERGFHQLGWQEHGTFINASSAPTPHRAYALYLSQDGSVRCLAGLTPPRHGAAYSLIFRSTLADGTELITYNRQGPLPLPPQMQAIDNFYATDEEQWAFHQQRLQGQQVLSLSDPDELLQHSRAHSQATLDYWRAEGMVAPREDYWQLSWSGAYRLLRLMQGLRTRLRRAPKPVATVTTPEAVAQSEALMLQQSLNMIATQGGTGRGRIWVFLFTALAFAVLSALGMGSGWQFGLALTLVLLLHELGHFAAMKLFGYRDLSIFFLPFMGAATSGKKDDTKPWQEVLVFIAGPLPGLLLSVLLLALIFSGHTPTVLTGKGALASFLLSCIFISLAINYLNLLPVLPLDGGRIAELLLFTRFPRARFGFFALGTAALLLAGIHTQDGVLWVIALFLGLSLPFQYRQMLVARSLRPHYGSCRSEAEALPLLAEALTSHGQSWQPMVRVNIARSLLPRLRNGVAGWRTTLLGSLLYLGVLLIPVAGLMIVVPGVFHNGVSISKVKQQLAEWKELQRLQKRLDVARDPGTKIQADIALAYYYEAHNNPSRQLQYLHAAYQQVDPQQPLGRFASLARSQYSAALYPDQPQAALQLYADAAATLARQRPEDQESQALLLSEKARMLDMADAPVLTVIAARQQALDIRNKGVGEAEELWELRSELAQDYRKTGDIDRASDLLRSNLADTAKRDDGAGYYESDLGSLSWLLLQKQQPQAVLDLLLTYPSHFSYASLGSTDDDDDMAPLARQAEGYAHLQRGDGESALAVFSQLEADYTTSALGRTPSPQAVGLYLDSIQALRLAHQDSRAEEAKVRQLMQKFPDEAEDLENSQEMNEGQPDNMRLQAEVRVLHDLGYHGPPRKASCPPSAT